MKENSIKVYLEDMTPFYKLKGGSEFKVLIALWKRTNWNNEPIYIEKGVRDEIAEEINMKPQSVADTLTRLVKKDLLLKDRRIVYKLNPVYFFKGDDSSRKEIMKVSIHYKLEE